MQALRRKPCGNVWAPGRVREGWALAPDSNAPRSWVGDAHHSPVGPRRCPRPHETASAGTPRPSRACACVGQEPLRAGSSSWCGGKQTCKELLVTPLSKPRKIHTQHGASPTEHHFPCKRGEDLHLQSTGGMLRALRDPLRAMDAPRRWTPVRGLAQDKREAETHCGAEAAEQSSNEISSTYMPVTPSRPSLRTPKCSLMVCPA